MPTISYYNKKGERLPGVTTVLKNLGWNREALMYWANQMGLKGKNHKEVAEAEADAGTVGHYLIWCHLKNINPDLSKYPKEAIEKGETSYLNFLEWEKMVSLEVESLEVNLISEQYQYGGTPDIVGRVTGKLALIDLKTGGAYPDHLLQLSAYKILWEENYPDKLLEGGYHLLRIGKENAEFDHLYRQALPEAWRAFQACLELHKLQKTLKKQI